MYCVSCNKTTANKNSSVRKNKQNNKMLLSNCAICGMKKKKLFIINRKLHNFNNIWNDYYKMNKIIDRFLLTWDKFTPELHLKQPGFNYSACGPFTKYHERIHKFRETGNLKHLCRNELDKTCFPHDAAYSDSIDLDKKLFQIRFWKIELMKLLEIVNMMDTKEH